MKRTGIIIFSGGQTGVDRAAWDAAMEIGLATDGWVPKGRRAENGAIPEQYPCRETKSDSYPERTRKNIQDTDGTLILYVNVLAGGTYLTEQIATRMKKPTLLLNLHSKESSESAVEAFVRKHKIRKLNVAGPRESSSHDVYKRAFHFLQSAFQTLLPLRP